MKSAFSSRLDSFEKEITDRVVASITERVYDTVDKVVCERLGSMRAEIDNNLAEMEDKLTSLVRKTEQQASKQDILLNIVIHKLPESNKENTVVKVNGLIKDGLKLKNVTIEKAERKKTKKEGAHGLIIATCKSKEDKELIMRNKTKLKSSRNFSDVLSTMIRAGNRGSKRTI